MQGRGEYAGPEGNAENGRERSKLRALIYRETNEHTQNQLLFNRSCSERIEEEANINGAWVLR